MSRGNEDLTASCAKRNLWGNWPSWLLLTVLGILVLATFRDYGYSWDEIYQDRGYGQAVIRFMTTLGEDRTALTTLDHYLYGGTFDTLAELLVSISPLEPRNTRHLANALAGFAGIIGCWLLACRIGGGRCGFWAVLFLSASAPWYGHMFINAKDIPFAAGMIWSLYFLLRLIEGFPRPSIKSSILLGLTLGLTLGVRIGGVLLLLYMGVAALIYAIKKWHRYREGMDALFRDGRSIAVSAVAVALPAWLLMIAFWPAAMLSPFAIPLEAIGAANRFQWDGLVLWNGRELSATDLPWNYLPVVYGVHLPEVLTLLYILALIWGVFQAVQLLRKAWAGASTIGVPLLLLAILFPVVWAIARGSTTYDNGRHFLFVLPPLACLAALCWTSLLEWAARIRRWFKPLLVALLCGALVMPIIDLISLHPYQYTYLNAFAGGMPQGSQRFDTDYWITSYREASFALIEHARKAAAATNRSFEDTGFSVTVLGPPDILDEALPGNFMLTRFDPQNRTNYLVASTRWHGDQQWPDWQTIAEVGRKGMRFAVVKVDPAIAQIVEAMKAQ